MVEWGHAEPIQLPGTTVAGAMGFHSYRAGHSCEFAGIFADLAAGRCCCRGIALRGHSRGAAFHHGNARGHRSRIPGRASAVAPVGRVSRSGFRGRGGNSRTRYKTRRARMAADPRLDTGRRQSRAERSVGPDALLAGFDAERRGASECSGRTSSKRALVTHRTELGLVVEL